MAEERAGTEAADEDSADSGSENTEEPDSGDITDSGEITDPGNTDEPNDDSSDSEDKSIENKNGCAVLVI